MQAVVCGMFSMSIIKNPDAPLKVTPTSDPNCFNDIYAQIAEGRYDYYLVEKFAYDNFVVKEDGSLHQYADKLSAATYTSVKTYPVIAKDQAELADAVNKELKALRDDGTLEKLAVKFHGYNTFEYINK